MLIDGSWRKAWRSLLHGHTFPELYVNWIICNLYIPLLQIKSSNIFSFHMTCDWFAGETCLFQKSVPNTTLSIKERVWLILIWSFLRSKECKCLFKESCIFPTQTSSNQRHQSWPQITRIYFVLSQSVCFHFSGLRACSFVWETVNLDVLKILSLPTKYIGFSF